MSKSIAILDTIAYLSSQAYIRRIATSPPPLQKKEKKYLSGKYRAKFKEFVSFHMYIFRSKMSCLQCWLSSSCTSMLIISSFQEWAYAMARHLSSVCPSVNVCANHFFSHANGRIATKLAHDGIQVSVHPGCAQGFKVMVKVKVHVIRALSWILGMSYSVIDGLV